MMWPTPGLMYASGSHVKGKGKGYSKVLNKPKRSQSTMEVQGRKKQTLLCVCHRTVCRNVCLCVNCLIISKNLNHRNNSVPGDSLYFYGLA